MTKDDLDEIAKREPHCKTWGEAVTISRAERDQLVALARDGMRWRFVRDNADITLDYPVWFLTDTGQRINVGALSRQEAERAVDAAMIAKEEA